MTSWYRTGTVSVENASPTVTGSLTAWLMAAKAGDAFVGPDGARYEITAVTSNTEIEIYPAYAGSTASAQSYAIERISTAWNSVSELSVTIAETAEAFQRGFAMRSTSSIEIGAGEHEFAVPPGLPILPGATLKIASAASGEEETHWIAGVVTEYEGQTLKVLAQSWEGEGDTRASWNINIAGSVGPQGQSAYQVAVAEGFSGDEEAWLASLVGPAGPEWLDWQGSWSAGTYNEGDGVEHNGSTYRANTTTSQEPPHADWDLVASKGQDGLGTGDVVGPASSTNNSIAVFDGTTGKLIKDGGVAIDDVMGDVVGPSSSTNNSIAVFDGTTGKIIKDGGIAASSLGGFRNKIINGDFTINQRGGTRTPGIGVYGYDRWKGHAGGLEQIIEGLEPGEYTLTWTGGGVGTFAGVTAASPFTATSAGGNVSVVVPSNATRVSLVPGDATAEDDPFSPRHPQQELALCQRYYVRMSEVMSLNFGAYAANAFGSWWISFPTTMRASPTLGSRFVDGDYSTLVSLVWGNPTRYGARLLAKANAASTNRYFIMSGGDYIEASAEL